jgi:hypothetical protein
MNRQYVNAVTGHPIVDAVLDRYRDELGQQLLAYRNHVYRCITYHQLFIGGTIPDFAALAWATHDLGIWTAGTFDYLGASADLASLHADEFGIDVSRGFIAGRIGRSQVRAVVAQLPYSGFHAFLARGLTGYAVRHPLRPLPMLRW